VLFKQPETNSGSAILKYRLYQSSEKAFTKKFLLAEVSPDEAFDLLEDGYLSMSFAHPQLAVPYYFKVAAVNGAGEGILSETTQETMIGTLD
jgi:hypothetical protein